MNTAAVCLSKLEVTSIVVFPDSAYIKSFGLLREKIKMCSNNLYISKVVINCKECYNKKAPIISVPL